MTSDEYRGKLVIVLTGEEAPMDALLAAHAALASRFPTRLRLEEWGADKAARVVERELAREKLGAAPEALAAAREG